MTKVVFFMRTMRVLILLLALGWVFSPSPKDPGAFVEGDTVYLDMGRHSFVHSLLAADRLCDQSVGIRLYPE